MSVPYGDRFVGTYHKEVTAYAGASLAALTKLATRKGYRLVGSDHRCYNAFFLRNDVGTEHFPEISPRECFFGVHADFAQQEILPKVQSLEWEEV